MEDMNVDGLDGQIEIERVITQNEVHLFRATSPLAYFDSPVYAFDGARVVVENPVPVFTDDMKKIGFATVSVEYRETGIYRMVGDLVIDYATEERLLTELGIVPFYPRIFGSMSVPNLPLFDFSKRVPVGRFKLDGIQLSRAKTEDYRLLPIKAS